MTADDLLAGEDRTVPADLLRRALKCHDAIVVSLGDDRLKYRLSTAVDKMQAVKAEAADLGCYPQPGDVLR